MLAEHRSVIRRLSIWCAGILMLALPLHSQNSTGSIVGAVTDSKGALLANATVTVTNNATGEKRISTTSGSGEYEVLTLQPGLYTVEIDGAGFKRYVRNPVEVQVEQSTRVNAEMAVGAVSEEVTVSTTAPIMQTETASLGQAVEGRAVTEMPLNGRNVLALVALVPGVVPQGSSSGNLTGQNVFAAGNYQIDGGNANQGSVLVDGSPVNTSYGNAVELVMDQYVVQEFNAQTHNNTAEFGMYTGGVINMSTKSGTNAFHGTAFEYVRNTILDANTFFTKRNNGGKQAWHQNQFGGNFGGPIFKEKAFFFGDYQGYRQTNGQQIGPITVPTQAELSGDFTGAA